MPTDKIQRYLKWASAVIVAFLAVNVVIGVISPTAPQDKFLAALKGQRGWNEDELLMQGYGYEGWMVGGRCWIKFKVTSKQPTETVRVYMKRVLHMFPWHVSAYSPDDE